MKRTLSIPASLQENFSSDSVVQVIILVYLLNKGNQRVNS